MGRSVIFTSYIWSKTMVLLPEEDHCAALGASKLHDILSSRHIGLCYCLLSSWLQNIAHECLD